jgi:hypothetical protein
LYPGEVGGSREAERVEADGWQDVVGQEAGHHLTIRRPREAHYIAGRTVLYAEYRNVAAVSDVTARDA